MYRILWRMSIQKFCRRVSIWKKGEGTVNRPPNFTLKKKKKEEKSLPDLKTFFKLIPSVFLIPFQIKFLKSTQYCGFNISCHYWFLIFKHLGVSTSVFLFLFSLLTFHLKCISFLNYFIFSINVVHFILSVWIKTFVLFSFLSFALYI